MEVAVVKPDLSIYIGEIVKEVYSYGPEHHEWGIRFISGVEFENHDPLETFPPDGIAGMKLMSISMGLHDTTLHFFRGGSRQSIGVAPTKYSIYDPKHGGKVFPQWPEELEERGIPSMEGGELSQEPTDADRWEHEYRKKLAVRHAMRQQEAAEWLAKDQEGSDEGQEGQEA
jgi:hypothetical protein